MENHPQKPLTTYPKPAQTNEDHQLDEERVWFQAESIVHTSTFPMVLKAALELGVIDTIANVGNGLWLSPSEIALRLPTKPTNAEAPVLLDRMLQLLVSHSILKSRMAETRESSPTRKTERVYAAEPVCKFFLKDSDGSGSLVSMFLLFQTHFFFNTWTHLKDMILEGKDAWSSAHGMKYFEYMSQDKSLAELFNQAMSGSSIIIAKKVLEVYRGFEDVQFLVDVGGGIGTVIGLITSKYPHMKGINFDLAPVLANALIQVNQLKDGAWVRQFYKRIQKFCKERPYHSLSSKFLFFLHHADGEVVHVPGDMLIEVPKGDAIFMQRILHDWRDEDCIKILQNCWKSLPEKGKVIIVDMVTPIEPKDDERFSNIVFSMDMLMLTHLGGKERSISEFESLASKSGFSLCQIICRVHSYFVIEFHK